MATAAATATRHEVERKELHEIILKDEIDITGFEKFCEMESFRGVVSRLTTTFEFDGGDLSPARLLEWATGLRTSCPHAQATNDDLRVCDRLLKKLSKHYTETCYDDEEFEEFLRPIADKLSFLLRICLSMQQVNCNNVMTYTNYTDPGMHWACDCCHQEWGRFWEIGGLHGGFPTLSSRLCKLVRLVVLANDSIDDRDKERLRLLTSPKATSFDAPETDTEVILFDEPMSEQEFRDLEGRIRGATTCQEFILIYDTSLVILLTRGLINWSQHRLDYSFDLNDWSDEWASQVGASDQADSLRRAQTICSLFLERLNYHVPPDVIRKEFKRQRVMNIVQRVVPMARAFARLTNGDRWTPPQHLIELNFNLHLDQSFDMQHWLEPVVPSSAGEIDHRDDVTIIVSSDDEQAESE